MGLDASGKETTDEGSIVSYEVTGIGECNVSKIAIPREHNGKPVTKIKENAFKGNTTLKSIIVGDNIENIGGNAFQGSSIITASINTSTSGNYIFWNARSLEKVVIGKNVTKLGMAIFLNCNNLNDLTILTEKADINNGILGSAGSLKEVKTNEENSKYMVEDGILFSKDGSKIYAYPIGKVGNTYIFSSNVNEIGDSAFAFSNLKAIDIPSTVEKVGSNAFQSTGITTANIDASKIEYYIFWNSISLEKVVIGKNVTKLGGSVFLNCSNLKSITYLGTMDEWNNTLGKTSLWKNGNTSITKVICSDGEINL